MSSLRSLTSHVQDSLSCRCGMGVIVFLGFTSLSGCQTFSQRNMDRWGGGADPLIENELNSGAKDPVMDGIVNRELNSDAKDPVTDKFVNNELNP